MSGASAAFPGARLPPDVTLRKRESKSGNMQVQIHYKGEDFVCMQALVAWNRLPAVVRGTGTWQDGQRTAPSEWTEEEQGCFTELRMVHVRDIKGINKV